MESSNKIRENYKVTKIGKLVIDDSKLEDYKEWEKLRPNAIFKSAWDLVVDSYKIQGKDLNELRFQRSVVNIVKKWS